MSYTEEDAEEGSLLEDEIEEMEEDGEYIPPGYLAADGPYRHFCSCENFNTCDFCKWFHLIKECSFHGLITRRPFRSCYCQTEASPKIGSLARKEDRREQCSCDRKGQLLEKPCDCLEEVRSDSSDESLPDWDEDKFRGLDGAIDGAENEREIQFQDENDWASPETENFNGDWKVYEGEIMNASPGTNIIQDEDPGEAGDPRPCNCDVIPPSRSESSTEIDSSESEDSDTPESSSYSTLTLGGTVDDTSSDPGSSEATSVDAVEVDLSRVKWTSAASDDSLDDSSSFESVRIEPIDISVKRIQRERQRRLKKKTNDEGIHHYLVLQKSQPTNYLDVCKSKKDQVKSYSLTLMDLRN